MRGARIRRNYAGHGSLASYVVGFLLALLLTVAAFWLVLAEAAPAPVLLVAVLVLAALQIGVHLRYFVHIGGSAEERWTLIALIMAIMFLLVVVVGSLWVVHELNSHTMPSMAAGG